MLVSKNVCLLLKIVRSALRPASRTSRNLHHLLRAVWQLRWTRQNLRLRETLCASHDGAARVLVHDVGAPVSAQNSGLITADVEELLHTFTAKIKASDYICYEDAKPTKRITYLFLWRVSVPEYELPWNMLYWKGVPKTTVEVNTK